MVESKFVVLQMIPHTLFIEWDFGHYSRHCSLAVLLFMTLFTSRWHFSLAVVKSLFTHTVLFIYEQYRMHKQYRIYEQCRICEQ